MPEQLVTFSGSEDGAPLHGHNHQPQLTYRDNIMEEHACYLDYPTSSMVAAPYVPCGGQGLVLSGLLPDHAQDGGHCNHPKRNTPMMTNLPSRPW